MRYSSLRMRRLCRSAGVCRARRTTGPLLSDNKPPNAMAQTAARPQSKASAALMAAPLGLRQFVPTPSRSWLERQQIPSCRDSEKRDLLVAVLQLRTAVEGPVRNRDCRGLAGFRMLPADSYGALAIDVGPADFADVRGEGEW